MELDNVQSARQKARAGDSGIREFPYEDINLLANDLETGEQTLQLNALREFNVLLDGDINFVDRVLIESGENTFFYFFHLAQYGLDNEAQILALICLNKAVNRRIFSIEPVGQDSFIEFLIDNRLTPDNDISAINAAIDILTIDYMEFIERRSIFPLEKIIQILSELPLEVNSGQLIEAIVNSLPQGSTLIEIIISLLSGMMNPDYPKNLNYALRSYGLLVLNGFIDINEFISILPQYILSDNKDIVSTAFYTLEQLPVIPESIWDILITRISQQNNIEACAVFAINYMAKKSELWMQSPPSQLFEALILCIQNNSYTCGLSALCFLEPAVKTSNYPINEEIVRLITDFLQDQSSGKYALFAICAINQKIQTSKNVDWFFSVLQDVEEDIENLAAHPDLIVASSASDLLTLIHQSK